MDFSVSRWATFLPACPRRRFDNRRYRRCLLLLWMTPGDVVAVVVAVAAAAAVDAAAAPLLLPFIGQHSTESQSDWGEKVWKYNIWVLGAIEWPRDISAYNIHHTHCWTRFTHRTGWLAGWCCLSALRCYCFDWILISFCFGYVYFGLLVICVPASVWSELNQSTTHVTSFLVGIEFMFKCG